MLNQIDHVFVVNLDRRHDRLDSFYRNLPFPAEGFVERYRAVDGRELRSTARLLELFADNDFQYRRGVIGCALSHYRLWQLIAGDHYPHERTLIFEDDAIFSADSLRRWNQRVSALIPAGFDVLYLGGIPIQGEELDPVSGNGPRIDADAYISEPINPCFGQLEPDCLMGTFSYVLSKRGAERLCEKVRGHGMQEAVDVFMMKYRQEMEVYATVPLLSWSILWYESDVRWESSTLLDEL